MNTNKGYGHITIGYGSNAQSELQIIDYVRSIYIDNRFAGCCKLEDGTYCINVENLNSSGRNPINTMRLSEESLGALIANCLLYFQVKGIDVTELMKKASGNQKIEYSISDNLKPL